MSTAEISIHAPHARSDRATSSRSSHRRYFNPRSSCEERLRRVSRSRSRRNFNPRSSCEERQDERAGVHGLVPISIHAPHARSDLACDPPEQDCPNFNPRSSCEERRHHRGRQAASERISIHAPHARSDATTLQRSRKNILFQSTLLMRGATGRDSRCCPRNAYFNPRSSCEERPVQTMQTKRHTIFQSTLLMRGATAILHVLFTRQDISIHAPHARSDNRSRFMPATIAYFNPRSSCEERLILSSDVFLTSDFNPRSSCEERHERMTWILNDETFQSTLLMRGATSIGFTGACICLHFNPRSSCEERLGIC